MPLHWNHKELDDFFPQPSHEPPQGSVHSYVVPLNQVDAVLSIYPYDYRLEVEVSPGRGLLPILRLTQRLESIAHARADDLDMDAQYLEFRGGAKDPVLRIVHNEGFYRMESFPTKG